MNIDGIDPAQSLKENSLKENEQIMFKKRAFDNYCHAVRPRFLPLNCVLWAEAHHRAATTVIKYPAIMDTEADPLEWAENGDSNTSSSAVRSSDLHIQVAISHLTLALRCTVLTNHYKMDLHFHISQAYIARLQLILDRVPRGESVIKTISVNPDAMDIIDKVEKHLNEALVRVTAASNETIQDGYLYYYSCLKMAEYKMLAAACNTELHELEREDNMKESITYVIDTLTSRSMEECLDLHYLSMSQLSQILSSVKRNFAAARSYSKTLLTLSAVINRAFYSPESLNPQLRDECWRHLSQAMNASEKQLTWVKLHLGPLTLNEKVSAGYASWSFEETRSVRRKATKTLETQSKKGLSSANIFLGFSRSKSTVAEIEVTPIVVGGQPLETPQKPPFSPGASSVSPSLSFKPSPPKSVPPLLLPPSKNVKVTLNGVQVHPTEASNGGVTISGKIPQPPAGPVPLHAMGHNPIFDDEKADDVSVLGDNAGNDEDNDEYEDEGDGEEDNMDCLYPGPYGRRRRRRVPPLKTMTEVDQVNQQTYLNVKSSKPSYLPTFGTKKSSAAASQKESTETNDDEVVSKTTVASNRLGHPAAEWSLQKFKMKKPEPVEEEVGDEDENDDEKENEEDDEGEHDGDDEGPHHTRNATTEVSVMKKSRSRDEDDDQVSDYDDEEDENRTNNIKSKPKEELRASGGMFASRTKGSKKNKKITFEGGEEDEEEQHKKGIWANRGGILVRMFRKLVKKRNKTADAAIARNRRNRPFFSNPFAKIVVSAKSKEEYGMWASNNAYFSFMVLSRASRMDTVLLSQVLEIPDGERANFSFYSASSQQQLVLKTYYTCRKYLYKNCNKLIPLCFTLKELNQKSYLELSQIFASQESIFRVLQELERALCEEMSKTEYFLPLINIAPVLTRRRNLFDDVLMDSKKLSSTLFNEFSQIQRKIQAQRAKVQRILTASSPAENTIHANTAKNARKLSIYSQDSQKTSKSQALLEESDRKKKLQQSLLTLLQKRQIDEEKEEVVLGKMTYSLSSLLDGTVLKASSSSAATSSGGGARDMLLQHLALDECLLVWHAPHKALGNQKIQVLLVWRNNSASTYPFYSSSDSIIASELKSKGRRPPKNKAKSVEDSKKERKKGIVMEIARCDCDGATLNAMLQNYLIALHTPAAPQRMALTADALRSLSCALSISELLTMLPPTVRSFVICCPHSMRVIPWHLLLIEVPKKSMDMVSSPSETINASMSFDSQVYQDSIASTSMDSRSSPMQRAVVEVHWCEKHVIRMGPSLTLFELCAVSASKLKQSVGLHRMCAIDGELDGLRTPGMRATDLEVACVTDTFTADPADRHVLMNDAAVPARLQTGIGKSREEKLYKIFKQEVFIKREEKINHLKLTDLAESKDDGEQRVTDMDDDMSLVKGSNKIKKNDEDGGDDDDEDEKKDDEDEDEEEAELLRMEENMYALSMCRVLHVGASKILRPKASPELFAALRLPSKSNCLDLALKKKPSNPNLLKKKDKEKKLKQLVKENKENNPAESEVKPIGNRNFNNANDPAAALAEAERDTLNSADVVQQLYVKNCALCVLSRFGLTDDVVDFDKVDVNSQFLEAFHYAGANTLIYPLWASHGIGRLANLLVLIRFYSVLSSNSKDRVSIAETLRQSQLWLRNITADDAIRFLQKSAISQKARDVIIEEMESYVTASLPSEVAKNAKKTSVKAPSDARFVPQSHSANTLPKELADDTVGNRVGGNRKFFTHVLCWGAFAVSGQGGGVHHPNLTEDAIEEEGAEVLNDRELNNIRFEAQILRMEGKIEEAILLEKYIRKKRMDKVKAGYNVVKNTGLRAGRGIMDTLDYLDKKLLDQDSDSVSLSDSVPSDDDDDDDDDENGDNNEEDEEDGDEDEDEDDDLQSGVGSSQKVSKKKKIQKKKKRKRYQHQPIELASLLKTEDAEYDKWRAKIGKLESKIIPVDKIVESMKLKHEQKLREVSAEKQKHENFEYNIVNTLNEESGGVNALKVVKEKMIHGNRTDTENKKSGNAKYLKHEDEEEEEESDHSSDESDVDLKTKIMREVQSEIRTYREAADLIMHPLSGGKRRKQGKNTEKRLKRGQNNDEEESEANHTHENCVMA